MHPTAHPPYPDEKANRTLGASLAEAGMQGSRERAKSVLLNAADRLRRRALQLETLAYATEHLSGPAEEALWEVVTGQKIW